LARRKEESEAHQAPCAGRATKKKVS